MSDRAGAQHPSPLPVMTILLVSALLAALGIIMVARSSAPAVGGVFLGIGVLGAVYGVVLAVRNVRISRTIERRSRRPAPEREVAERPSDEDVAG